MGMLATPGFIWSNVIIKYQPHKVSIMTSVLPDFSTVEPKIIEDKLKQLLSNQKQQVSTLIETTQLPTWQNLMAPLELLDAELQAFWNPISHLNHVKDSPELRENYALCLSHLSDYSTWLGHHQGLFQRLTELKASDSFATLTPPQQTVIDNELRDFKLAGIALSSTDKARYAEISSRLSTLTTQFESNLIDGLFTSRRCCCCCCHRRHCCCLSSPMQRQHQN